MAPGDDGVPNIARIYDHLLGGSHNFAADRERAAEMIASRPTILATARANRLFLRHAVEHALDHGIRQFLDLGAGIPTVGNVHEIAHRRDPRSRVAYVENEAVAVAHSTAILADVPGATITDADLRDVDGVLAAPGVAGLLDPSRPVAILSLATLHFLPDHDEPARVLARYRAAFGPGTVLAVTHSSDDFPEHPAFAEASREVARLAETTSHPLTLRSRAEIERLVREAGFVPDADGLREVRCWASPPQDEPLGGYAVISEPVT